MKRRAGRPANPTLADVVRGVADRVCDEQRGEQWPSTRYALDPIGFCHTVLGVDLWSFQTDFLEAIRDNRHVSVAGGRKIGKDFAVGCAALWFYASFENARVILLAPSAKQLDGILFREIRMLWANAGRCLDCKRDDPQGPRPCSHSAVLSGRVGQLARTGIRADDFREIVGMTAVSEGGLRGFSGARILAIEDEASDIDDSFDTALIGNLAGSDCRRVLISNPTRPVGFFHASHHEERHLYKTMVVSSEDNPNVAEGREVFRGLADAQWLAEREQAWGRGSPLWQANVEGKFVHAEAGQLFTLEDVTGAEARWADTVAEGRLVIGIDVAGEGHDGDETAIAVRRGRKVLELVTFRGIGPDALREHAVGLLKKHRQSWEARLEFGDENLPTIVVDRDGLQGARAYDALASYRAQCDENGRPEFRLVGFRGSAPPVRNSDTYRLSRDALFGGLLDAFREGLAIPSDVKLESELVALRWIDSDRGKQMLIRKSDLKDRLGRSPDRCDAIALSTWGSVREVARPSVAIAPAPTPHEQHQHATTMNDPYALLGASQGAGGTDPYMMWNGGGGRR